MRLLRRCARVPRHAARSLCHAVTLGVLLMSTSATSRPASRRTGEVESAGAAEKAYRVAKMYETNGLTEKAVELYKGVIRDYPGSSAAKRAQDDVRRLSRP